MKLYTTKKDVSSAKKIVLDDMILTKDMPTKAGSKMLDGFMSLFDAEIISRLKNAGYEIAGKADVGEFSIDLLGETGYEADIVENGVIKNASAEILKTDDVLATVNMDVNGSVRRAAAQNGLVSVKPTYGTVSRFGTIPVVCSGETVSVMAKTADGCAEILNTISGHDDKDGTSLSEEICASVKANDKKASKIAVLTSMNEGIDSEVSAKIDNAVASLKASGIEVVEIESDVIAASKVAWNILMTAELCNNVSRYDGVKYGYRSQNFTNIDELYTNSRTEAFGDLLKTAILFGSETLSTDNYMKVYDKALRTRRVIVEKFAELFENYDAVLMPACSKMEYSADVVVNNKHIAFEENFYTAPASVTGLPAVVSGGVQLVGKAFSENMLLELAKILEKEGK